MNEPFEHDPAKPALPLDYRSSGAGPHIVRDSAGRAMAKFIGGIFAGFAITGAYLAIVFGASNRFMGQLFLASIIFKTTLGFVLVGRPGWKPVGLGILTSIALAILLIGCGIGWVIYTCSGKH